MLKVSTSLQVDVGTDPLPSPVHYTNMVLSESQQCCYVASVAKGHVQQETRLSSWILRGLPEDKKLLLCRKTILGGGSKLAAEHCLTSTPNRSAQVSRHVAALSGAGMRCGEAAAGGGFLLLPRGALLLLGVCNALSLEIKASPKVQAFIGEQVSLKCSFKSISPITDSLTVDWTYRPLTGGQMETIFHYQSVPYPTTVGKFKDRISWVGNVAKGDASVAIQSPVMSDNGTFICSVKNPPDVYHNIPQTVLIVTERGLSFQLTSAALLSILVFLPSVIVVVLLLVRMGRKFGVLKEKKKSGYKKSSIEVSDEPEHTETDDCLGKLRNWCLNCVDTDEEDPY